MVKLQKPTWAQTPIIKYITSCKKT